ncbi:MAG: diguanylate cyclase, partial [Lachnospiraceae bacterium]|nr:diguanylate cyclase [Lachnospiraceae bacterium]
MHNSRLRSAFRQTLCVTVAIFFGFIIAYLFLYASAKDLPGGVLDLSSNWFVRTQDGSYAKPSAPEQKLERGEELYVRFYAPEIYDTHTESICLASQGTVFSVFDYRGRRLYYYGVDQLQSGEMIPRKLHYIYVPEDATSHNITIVFVGANDGARVHFKDSFYGDIEKISGYYFRRKGFPILCGIFLMGFGFLLSLLRFFFKRWFTDLHGTFVQGLLLATIGVYGLCYNDLFGAFVRDQNIASIVEYVTLLLTPILIQYCIILNHSGKTTLFHRLVMWGQIAILAVMLILHGAGIIYINAWGYRMHMLLGIWAVYALIWLLQIMGSDLRSTVADLYANISRGCIYFGLLILLICASLDFILSMTGSSSGIFPEQSIRGFFVLMGGTIMVGSMMVSYFFHMVGVMQEKDVKKQLEGLAYTDELTGLANRARCDQVMTQFAMAQIPCILISFDLDGLKKINDEKGHHAGDEYLNTFSDLLFRFFGKDLLAGRMGGDEFL